MKSLPSIQQRLMWTLLLLMALLALVATVSVGAIMYREFDELMDEALVDYADMVQNVLQTEDALPPSSRNHHFDHSSREQAKFFVWQLVDLQTTQLLRQSTRAPTQALAVVHVKEIRSDHKDWVILTRVMPQHPDWLLVVAQSAHDKREELLELLIYPLSTLIALGLLCTGLMYWRTQQELRPLFALGHAVKSLRPELGGTALAPAQRHELTEIVFAINTLIARFRQLALNERAFSAHAAHALRTPLAGMQVQLALAQRNAPPALNAALSQARLSAHRLSLTVQALLTLFRSESPPKKIQISLGELLPENQWLRQVNIMADEQARLYVDADLFSPVLINLLDNAVQHNARQIRLEVCREASMDKLLIEDDGSGCSAQQLQVLREALLRSSMEAADPISHDATNGSSVRTHGLGLLLAHKVCQVHQGQLLLLERSSGFALQLVLPGQ